MLRKIALLAVLLLISAPALAAKGSSRDRAACGADSRRFCRSVLGSGDMAVLSCLQANRYRLSRGCRRVLARSGV